MGEEVEELVKRLRSTANNGVPDFTNSKLLDEAADTIESLRSSLTRVEEERDARQTDLTEMKDRLERECEAAQKRGDKDGAFILEGGYIACEALLDFQKARLSRDNRTGDKP